jgi:Resolvase, N terminal domain
VVGIDRPGRNAAKVMMTIRNLGERGIVLRSLREGIDTSNASGRMVAGVLASLAELELEWGGSGALQRVTLVGHAGSISGDRRRWTQESPHWRDACTAAGNGQHYREGIGRKEGHCLPGTRWRPDSARVVSRN